MLNKRKNQMTRKKFIQFISNNSFCNDLGEKLALCKRDQ